MGSGPYRWAVDTAGRHGWMQANASGKQRLMTCKLALGSTSILNASDEDDDSDDEAVLLDVAAAAPSLVRRGVQPGPVPVLPMLGAHRPGRTRLPCGRHRTWMRLGRQPVPPDPRRRGTRRS